MKADVDALTVAAQLAHSDDDQQAEFFNVFASELRKVCETHFARDTQLVQIEKHLNKDAEYALGFLCSKEDE